MMELTVLVVPDCPNASVLDERLAEVLADRRWVSVMRRVIDDDEQAARWGMRGSPTLLIDGVDPFADPGVPASVSCRMYRDEDGRLEGAPSVAALRRALDQA
ncbi:thioredoxin family protein [Streptosporangium sp. NPDC001681]|uniref:thioredoxin family protein n=1 Tax=Streptosporangium sp. NPDC001681 TaxID=3154395 RepID=UPI003327FDFA